MAYFLHIETTSTICSVAISENKTLLAIKEQNNGYTHAENLHLFIEQTLNEAGIDLNQLNAVSVSKGPGSYTGLRIGHSSAKGLCYALNIPLIAIDTLQALAHEAVEKQFFPINTLFCPMIDARRMEVYMAIYNQTLELTRQPEALIIESNVLPNIFEKQSSVCFFGDGMEKCKALISADLPNSIFIESILPSSKSLISLAYQKFTLKQFEDVAYSEPFYLKNVYFANKQ